MRNADLNLFAVFEALERERSVTRAADALGLSQPAVSHALNRLRDLLKDQLFVRAASGMEPTPRALAMAGPIREAVTRLQSTVDIDRFDPKSARDSFALAMNNFAAIVFAAPLAAAVARQAPNIRLAIRPSGTLDLDLLLARGAIDLAIGEIPGLDPSDKRHLLDDRYVVVMRRGHASAKGRLTAKAFAAAAHLKISSIGEDTSFIERELAKRSLGRSILLEAPYIAAGAILNESDIVGVVAQRIALELCSVRDLIWREVPFGSPAIRVGMTWPQIYERRMSHRWLRSTIKGLL